MAFKNTKYVRALVAACVAAVIIILGMNVTMSTPATPRWEVWVVDRDGHPLKSMIVRLSWQNFSVETTGHEEDLQTDENGYVVFPARNFRASILDHFLGAINSARAGVHASFGPHAYVFTFGHDLEGTAVTDGYVADWTGKPDHMQSRIVAEPMR